MSCEEQIIQLERIITKHQERITVLEDLLARERQEREREDMSIILSNQALQGQFSQLMSKVSEVIAIMTPPLHELMAAQNELDEVYDGTFALKPEDIAELSMQHHKAAVRVSRAYGKALIAATEN